MVLISHILKKTINFSERMLIQGLITAIFLVSALPGFTGSPIPSGSCTSSINDSPLQSASGEITGADTVCILSAGVIYSIAPIPGATGYSWIVPPGALLVSGLNTTLITVSFPSGASSGALSVAGTGTSIIYSKDISVIGTIPVIAGPLDVCKGEIVTYSTQLGRALYDWTWPAFAGTLQAGGDGYNFLTIKWIVGSPSVRRKVSVSYKEGNCITSSFIMVMIYPLTPSVNSNGGATSCVSQSKIYNTEADQINYIWSLPLGGGTITYGQGTNSVTVLWNIAGSRRVNIIYDSFLGCPMTPGGQNVQVYPILGDPVFIAGALFLCMDAPDETYIAVATESLTTIYSSLPASAGLINATTGVMNWNAAFTGMAYITFTATGCSGPKSVTRDVMILPYPVTSLVYHY